MIQRIVSAIVLLICILPLPFCKKGHSQHRHIELTNAKFNTKLESLLKFSIPLYSVSELNEQINDVHIIDTREKAEFEISHIPGAQFGGYKNFNPNHFLDIPKTDTIVLYCSVGYRSEKAAERMQKAGYTNVFNLYGSIFEWVNQGYPVIDNKGNETSQVHTYNKKWGQWVDPLKIKKVN